MSKSNHELWQVSSQFIIEHGGVGQYYQALEPLLRSVLGVDYDAQIYFPSPTFSPFFISLIGAAARIRFAFPNLLCPIQLTSPIYYESRFVIPEWCTVLDFAEMLTFNISQDTGVHLKIVHGKNRTQCFHPTMKIRLLHLRETYVSGIGTSVVLEALRGHMCQTLSNCLLVLDQVSSMPEFMKCMARIRGYSNAAEMEKARSRYILYQQPDMIERIVSDFESGLGGSLAMAW